MTIREDPEMVQLMKMGAKLIAAEQRITELEAENARLRRVIERDRTRACDMVRPLMREVQSRSWLTEGRGSYEWDDDRYRQEFGDAIAAILKACEPIAKYAADLSDCPTTTEEVELARKGLAAAPTPEPRADDADPRGLKLADVRREIERLQRMRLPSDREQRALTLALSLQWHLDRVLERPRAALGGRS